MEIIRNKDRGFYDHGWLKTYHTFSFARYYNPDRIHFGALRVVNDDWVEGNQGFGSHPHDNMEIISIPLAGKLEHKDSTGTSGVIHPGEVQVMSAGTGVVHSEKNPDIEPVQFLQIWIIPNRKNVTPRYDQKRFEEEGCIGQPQLLVSPDGMADSLWIYQNAFISRLKLDKGTSFAYERFSGENGVLTFLLEGSVTVNDMEMNRRDTLLAMPESKLDFNSQTKSEFLFIEVPMQA